jgi:hypothetical protein
LLLYLLYNICFHFDIQSYSIFDQVNKASWISSQSSAVQSYVREANLVRVVRADSVCMPSLVMEKQRSNFRLLRLLSESNVFGDTSTLVIRVQDVKSSLFSVVSVDIVLSPTSVIELLIKLRSRRFVSLFKDWKPISVRLLQELRDKLLRRLSEVSVCTPSLFRLTHRVRSRHFRALNVCNASLVSL